MTWRTIVLTKDCKLSLRLKHLVINSDEITTVPLEEIGQLVIENPNIVMTGHLLNALSQHKITTIICNEKHLPHSHINLVYGHFRQVETIKKQIDWPDQLKQILWQYIVKEKIKNQKKVLEKIYNEKFENFDHYISQVEPDDVTNREGHAAKVYFNRMFGLHFIRGIDDPINWGLNYGYSIILALFSRVITTKGLLTELGIHHRSQFNHYNLASDFMEVYRPIVDLTVKQNVYEQFTRKEKRALLNMYNMKIQINGRNQYLSNSVEIFVDNMVKFLNTGDGKYFQFPSFF